MKAAVTQETEARNNFKKKDKEKKKGVGVGGGGGEHASSSQKFVLPKDPPSEVDYVEK